MSNVKEKRTVFIIVSLMLSCIVITFPNIGTVRASGTVYTKADGTIDGTDKIQRDGNTYTLTDNINDGIIVDKDDIVIDGASYTLNGKGYFSSGVFIDYRSNVTVRLFSIPLGKFIVENSLFSEKPSNNSKQFLMDACLVLVKLMM